MSRTIDHADFLAKPGHPIRLDDFDPGYTAGFHERHDAKEKLRADVKRLSGFQDMLYADRRVALLVIFQGMDAAGKDGRGRTGYPAGSG